jgi:hypothetical protein
MTNFIHFIEKLYLKTLQNPEYPPSGNVFYHGSLHFSKDFKFISAITGLQPIFLATSEV